MARLKVVGYIESADLDPEHVDLSDDSGLSEQGYLDLIVGESGMALSLMDLDDVEVTKDDD